MEDGKDVLFFQRPLRVIIRPALTNEHTAQRQLSGGIAGVSAESDQVFLLRQLRRGIAVIAQDAHMVPAGGFADDKHHVSIIQALRRNVGEFFRRIDQGFIIGRLIHLRPRVKPQR